MESEIFGHRTRRVYRRRGTPDRLVSSSPTAAHWLLDEEYRGDAPRPTQAKLLRVLERSQSSQARQQSGNTRGRARTCRYQQRNRSRLSPSGETAPGSYFRLKRIPHSSATVCGETQRTTIPFARRAYSARYQRKTRASCAGRNTGSSRNVRGATRGRGNVRELRNVLERAANCFRSRR